jgi:hypothetical protein
VVMAVLSNVVILLFFTFSCVWTTSTRLAAMIDVQWVATRYLLIDEM